MAKKRKRTKRNFNTEPASNRIFYRKPSIMFFEFLWSGPGLVVAVLLYGTMAIFIHAFA
jgi:hypothetical protein